MIGVRDLGFSGSQRVLQIGHQGLRLRDQGLETDMTISRGCLGHVMTVPPPILGQMKLALLSLEKTCQRPRHIRDFSNNYPTFDYPTLAIHIMGLSNGKAFIET